MLRSGTYREELRKLNDRSLPWEKLERKNILITGGTGLIGSCLTDALLFRNEYMDSHIGIWVLCRSRKHAEEIFGEFLEREYFHLILQDVSKPILPDLNIKMDYMIHAASKGDPKSFVTDPLGVMNANILGMHSIIEFSQRVSPEKVVYISSGEAYGKLDLEADMAISETMTGIMDSLEVRNCYGISKRAAETMCISAVYEYQIPICIARLCHTYGPTMMEDENRVIFQFIANAMRQEDIVLKSAGAQKRSYCYVMDAAGALFTILLLGNAGEVYNVANEKSIITIRQLAERLSSYAGRSVQYAQQSDTERQGNSGIMHAVLDNAKLLELGAQMDYDITSGIEQTIRILGEEEAIHE